MNPISSDDLQNLVAGYVLGDLDAEEVQAFEGLLQSPETASEVLELIEQTQQALDVAYLSEAIAPAQELRQRLLADFAKQPAEPEANSAQALDRASESTHRATARLPGWTKVAGLLGLSAIAGLLFSNYSLWRSQQLQSQQLESVEQVPETAQALRLTLDATENLAQIIAEPSLAQVSVALNLGQLQGALTIEALPPPPAGQVYVLWAVLDAAAPATTDDKGAILTHVFATDSTSRQQQSFLLPPVFLQQPDAVEAIAITVEDATAPQAHESEPIFKQSL